MTQITPAAVEINGVPFQIIDRLDLEEHYPYSWRPYVESIESHVIQSAELSGSSRPAKSTRPDELNWRLDDFSGGEGFKFLDSKDDDAFRRYYYSAGAVNVTTKGQVSLGYKWADSNNLGATTRKTGPFFTHRLNLVEAWVDDTMYSTPPGNEALTWTNKGVLAAAANNILGGPPRVHNQFVFAFYKDGTGAASSSKVRRITTAPVATTFWTLSNVYMGLVADGRAYSAFLQNTNQDMSLNRVSLTGVVPIASSSQVYAAVNYTSMSGMDSLVNQIFIVTQGTDEEPRIHIFDGSAGRERIKMPVGFRVDTTDAYDAARFLGDIFFVGGYRDGSTSSSVTGPNPVAAMLCYVSNGRSATWGVIRDGIEAHRIKTIHPGFGNLLLMGTGTREDAFGNIPKVFVADIVNGGISQLFEGILDTNVDIVSLDYYKGEYFAATRAAASGTLGTVKTYHTNLSGNHVFPSNATLYSSIWDFNYPEVDKIIESIEVITAPLPVGTTVSINLLLDDNTNINSDATGAALTHTGTGVTKTRFQLSGLDASNNPVTRRCRQMRVEITLNADGNGTLTPTVYQVNIKALPVMFTYFYQFIVNLEDDAPGTRGLTTTRTGAEKLKLLRALKDANPQSTFSVKIRYDSGSEAFPATAPLGTFAAVLQECEIHLSKVGNGYARVMVKRTDKN